jgi:electron transfer flavoprotein alpha subunit
MSQDVFVVIEHVQGRLEEISWVMLAAARQLSAGAGGGVAAVLLGKDAQGLSSDLPADRVLYADHPALAEFTSEAYQIVLAALIKEQSPRAVILGHTSIGTDIASRLSVQLALPLVGSCRTLETGGKFVSEICGGKIMAEGDLPGPTVLITMVPGGHKPEHGSGAPSAPVTKLMPPALDGLRLTLKQYVEPEAGDVDIAKEAILVSVGRGIQTKDNLGLANDLARAFGGQVCASRPVVDQGWLPTSRLVGKSGKHVKPKIYLALGISGAPEHVEGMGESDTIIAVNTDPNAPIFNVAKYGTTLDLLELVPALTARLSKEKIS